MLSNEQKTNQLHKHFLNVADTRDNRDFYEEALESSYYIRPDQLLMYGDQIPRGTDAEAINSIRNLENGHYFDYRKDENTVIHVVKRFIDYPLTKIDNGTDNAFKLVDSDGNIVKDIIPFNYYSDVYNYELKTSAGKKIYFGVGDWILDTFSGVLKFYGDIPEGVDHDTPPTISFYQYVGGTGYRQDTIGYDGVLLPISGWNISKNTCLVDSSNTILADDGSTSTISLQDAIVKSANSVQDKFAESYGWDGADNNEGIALSLQTITSLLYNDTKDIVKGHDDSADTDIGVLLSKKTISGDISGISLLFASNNLTNGAHTVEIKDNKATFDDGKSVSIKAPTVVSSTDTNTTLSINPVKVADLKGNFIVLAATDAKMASIVSGTYKVVIDDGQVSGVLLYWDKITKDYLPFMTNEENSYNFGFPLVVANGKVPPSVTIGALTLNSYNDSITPDYYGPRNNTITIATEDTLSAKSADYIVRNRTGYYLNDILKNIIADYTDKDGNNNFIGSIFVRSGFYQLEDALDISSFDKLNLVGEDKYTVILSKGIRIDTSEKGLITIQNMTIQGGIDFHSESIDLIIDDVIGSTTEIKAFKGTNMLDIRNSSFNLAEISNTAGTENSFAETEYTNNNIYNKFENDIISSMNSKVGNALYTNCLFETLTLNNVENDIVKSCFIYNVVNKPTQTQLIGNTVIKYTNVKFTEIPHMMHFPIMSKTSDNCLEYAKFLPPFVLTYGDDNTISLSIDDTRLKITADGKLTTILDAKDILIDTSKLSRNTNYDGASPKDAAKNSTLEEVITDLYGTKADLNTNGKVPLEELPDSVAYGGLLYVGSWSFEYKDKKDDRAKESEGYYVDGGKYPNYDDAIKNLSVDKTQNDTLQPGWFWIVASSKKNDDNPTAKQTAAVQLNIDTGKIVDDVAANVIYDDKGNKLGTPTGLVFTAGDWIIWNGTFFEKLDRAYQDAAYAILPVYTTGEHLAWSWRDSGDTQNKWGIGALDLGSQTIAESFDMINQELKKLAVKHPGILSEINLVPMKDYKTISYYDIKVLSNDTSDGIVDATYSTKLDLTKDSDVKHLRVMTPITDPKWKSSIFIGDKCTLVTSVDSNIATYNVSNTGINKINASDSTESPLIEDNNGYIDADANVHFTKIFDPYDNEISGSGYWKSVYFDFGNTNDKELNEGDHSFLASITDITPNNSFTKDAIGYTPTLKLSMRKPLDISDSNKSSLIKFTESIKYNVNELISQKVYCSGIPFIDKDSVSINITNIIANAIREINLDQKVLTIENTYSGETTDFDSSQYIKYSANRTTTDGVSTIDSFNMVLNGIPVSFTVNNLTYKQGYKFYVYDAYKNKVLVKLNDTDSEYTMNLICCKGLNENERICSGSGLAPGFNPSGTVGLYGTNFDSTANLYTHKNLKRELMKAPRIYTDSNGIETTIAEYQWPTGKYNFLDETESNTCDYSKVDNGDTTAIDGETYRWVTFKKFWNNNTGAYEPIIVSETNGYTIHINVADDKKSAWTMDNFTRATKNAIIQTQLVDFTNTNIKSYTKWLDCNSPYNGFSNNGIEDNQAGMYAGSSDALNKRITFGKAMYSGQIIVRIGIKMGSGLTLKNVSIDNII